MRTVTIQFDVKVPDNVHVNVPELVGKLIDIGLADAQDTVGDPDLDNEDARAIEIGELVVI